MTSPRRAPARGLSFVLCVTLAIAIAACGSGDDSATGGGGGSGDKQLSGTVEFWWWGEEEAPGFEKWVKQTAKQFEQQNPTVKIKLVEQTTGNLVQAAQAAQAAQKGPDIQFYWPVGFFQEDMFNGNLAELDDLLGEEELEQWPDAARNYATWQDGVYGVPMYSVGNPWVYRKDLFKKAGLDPEKPPTTFKELLAAGEKLDAAGITPIAAGMKDQFYADWPWLLFQACGIDSPNEWFDGFLGKTSLEDPQFEQTWEKIQATEKAGMYADNLFDLALYEGFDQFLEGNAAIATPVAPTVVDWERKLGSDKLGAFLTPCQDESELATKYPNAWHYVGIPSFSDQKEEAAAFLKFMHTPERGLALYRDAGALLGSDEINPKPDGAASRQMLEWGREDSYFALYYTAPPTVDEWIWPNVGKLLAGDMTPAEAARVSQETNQRWLKGNRRIAENFGEWQSQVTGSE
jgi:raffinose/stachyose/melibiose transport system substrate-binding protein